ATLVQVATSQASNGSQPVTNVTPTQRPHQKRHATHVESSQPSRGRRHSAVATVTGVAKPPRDTRQTGPSRLMTSVTPTPAAASFVSSESHGAVTTVTLLLSGDHKRHAAAIHRVTNRHTNAGSCVISVIRTQVVSSQASHGPEAVITRVILTPAAASY